MAHDVATRRVLYEIPGMQSIQPRDFAFAGADGQPLAGRLSAPPSKDRTAGVVVIVAGYPDPGFVKQVGCRFMDMQWSVSMAQLIAASGIVAVTYANRHPAADAGAIIEHLRANASSLGIDKARIGLWATSGHGPVAISLLDRVSCGVLSNPMTKPARAARLPHGVPIFVIRSGRDETPGLNSALDLFVTQALSQNHPMTVVNHAAAPHAFELYHDTSTTRQIMRQALTFLSENL